MNEWMKEQKWRRARARRQNGIKVRHSPMAPSIQVTWTYQVAVSISMSIHIHIVRLFFGVDVRL